MAERSDWLQSFRAVDVYAMRSAVATRVMFDLRKRFSDEITDEMRASVSYPTRDFLIEVILNQVFAQLEDLR